MKIQKVRELLGKVKTGLITLTLVSTISLTGCTIRYEDPTNKQLLDNFIASVDKNPVNVAINNTHEEIDKQKDNNNNINNNIKENLKPHIDEYRENIKQIINEAYLNSEENIQETADNLRALSENFAEKTNTKFESATLVRVVDGDTIVVDINDEEYKVRLIGINTPESVASEEYLNKKGIENTEEGFTASVYTKELLKDIDTVYLEKDVSETDKYGRLLRYVWLEVPEEITTDTIANYMVNGILLTDEKVAEPVSYEPDTKYEDEFEEIYENY